MMSSAVLCCGRAALYRSLSAPTSPFYLALYILLTYKRSLRAAVIDGWTMQWTVIDRDLENKDRSVCDGLRLSLHTSDRDLICFIAHLSLTVDAKQPFENSKG